MDFKVGIAGTFVFWIWSYAMIWCHMKVTHIVKIGHRLGIVVKYEKLGYEFEKYFIPI